MRLRALSVATVWTVTGPAFAQVDAPTMAGATVPANAAAPANAALPANATPTAAPVDPGPRSDAPGAGGALPGLTANELEYFNAGRDTFNEQENVSDGLGPRFNMDSCGGCHAQPAAGGTSPAVNPQAAVPSLYPGNSLPSFITANGPVREALQVPVEWPARRRSPRALRDKRRRGREQLLDCSGGFRLAARGR